MLVVISVLSMQLQSLCYSTFVFLIELHRQNYYEINTTINIPLGSQNF